MIQPPPKSTLFPSPALSRSRVAVVRVLDLGAATEQRVGLVEQEEPVARLDLVEHARERLLGLADVLRDDLAQDRKSTRLNSSHANISYAAFCLKKNKMRYYN